MPENAATALVWVHSSHRGPSWWLWSQRRSVLVNLYSVLLDSKARLFYESDLRPASILEGWALSVACRLNQPIVIPPRSHAKVVLFGRFLTFGVWEVTYHGWGRNSFFDKVSYSWRPSNHIVVDDLNCSVGGPRFWGASQRRASVINLFLVRHVAKIPMLLWNLHLLLTFWWAHESVVWNNFWSIDRSSEFIRSRSDWWILDPWRLSENLPRDSA